MHDQPKYKPLRPADQFGSIIDGRSARPIVEGTVPRGMLRDDVEFFTGRLANAGQATNTNTVAGVQAAATTATSTVSPNAAGQPARTFEGFVTKFPIEITPEALNRGQERFNIYCSVCHGRTGYGDGMIVQRGFRRPPSFHAPLTPGATDIRNVPIGYIFDVITNGFGAMPDYAAQITPEDRWKIIAYIRALQLSQGAKISDLTDAMKQKLTTGVQAEGGHAEGEHQ